MEHLPFFIPWHGHHTVRWEFLSSFLASYFLTFCGATFFVLSEWQHFKIQRTPSDLCFSEMAPLVLVSWLEMCPFQWFSAVKRLLSLHSEAAGISQDKSGRAVERRWFLASIILSSKFYFWVALQLPPSVKEKDAHFISFIMYSRVVFST